MNSWRTRLGRVARAVSKHLKGRKEKEVPIVWCVRDNLSRSNKGPDLWMRGTAGGLSLVHEFIGLGFFAYFFAHQKSKKKTRYLNYFYIYTMKHSLTILGVFAIVLAISCSSGTEEHRNEGTEEQRNEETKENSINPNGVSELAALMRKMESHTKVMKAETEGGRYKSRTIPLSYRDLKTATPTKVDQKDETFDSFADAFMNAMEQYYQTDAPQALRYKRVVATCIACHQRLCPGPVKAISKLYISSTPQLDALMEQ